MKKGFITLILVLTISAIALVISSVSLLRSVTEATISTAEESSNKAWAMVTACVETALTDLASSTNPVGAWISYNLSDTISIGTESCYYEVSGVGTSTERTIHASSSVNTYVRKIEVVASTNTPAMIVDSWQLVADFD